MGGLQRTFLLRRGAHSGFAGLNRWSSEGRAGWPETTTARVQRCNCLGAGNVRLNKCVKTDGPGRNWGFAAGIAGGMGCSRRRFGRVSASERGLRAGLDDGAKRLQQLCGRKSLIEREAIRHDEAASVGPQLSAERDCAT